LFAIGRSGIPVLPVIFLIVVPLSARTVVLLAVIPLVLITLITLPLSGTLWRFPLIGCWLRIRWLAIGWLIARVGTGWLGRTNFVWIVGLALFHLLLLVSPTSLNGRWILYFRYWTLFIRYLRCSVQCL
jgi:hypothetical protein